jgi:hypothetical protein
MANERVRRWRFEAAGGVMAAVAMAILVGAWAPGLVSAQTRKSAKAAGGHNIRRAARPAPAKGESQAAQAGRRDPFKIPAPPSSEAGPGGITGPLPPGKRGLVIGQLRLQGIVREDKTNTMIAVVTNATKRAYFLRENDQLYNGVVSKITPDSVYFTENTLQGSGHVVSHEVVKKLGSAPGEGR